MSSTRPSKAEASDILPQREYVFLFNYSLLLAHPLAPHHDERKKVRDLQF